MQNLDTIQNKIFMAVGPSRIAVLGLVLMADPRDEDVSPDVYTNRWQEYRDRLVEAQTMLNKDLDDLLAQASYQLPPDVEQARAEATQALHPFLALVTSDGFSPDRQADQLNTLRVAGLFNVESAITGFLTLMTKSLRAESHARQETTSLEMRNMVNQVDDLGRNIQLIAFNASVEAARIGEQGKGFSVIAAEIRQLSDKMEHTLGMLSSRLSHQA
ncbi:MAG: methyl-accepting chemotaxis protein [Pelagimonas sp.]|jgi:methyl-accepting chemotaxis protein|nr:methyl-accepting chemotaxis protein [Pelagimonas sp.]